MKPLGGDEGSSQLPPQSCVHLAATPLRAEKERTWETQQTLQQNKSF